MLRGNRVTSVCAEFQGRCTSLSREVVDLAQTRTADKHSDVPPVSQNQLRWLVAVKIICGPEHWSLFLALGIFASRKQLLQEMCVGEKDQVECAWSSHWHILLLVCCWQAEVNNTSSHGAMWRLRDLLMAPTRILFPPSCCQVLVCVHDVRTILNNAIQPRFTVERHTIVCF